MDEGILGDANALERLAALVAPAKAVFLASVAYRCLTYVSFSLTWRMRESGAPCRGCR